MIIHFKKFLLSLIALLLVCGGLFAKTTEDAVMSKQQDQKKYHNIGNIWLRVSNYGFFGSGNNSPRWPSLEYPGGSGIDYLYQGALWFGAKKQRRNNAGEKLYFVDKHNSTEEMISESEVLENPEQYPNAELVIDTLVSVGFDGDHSIFEFLPAYNQEETGIPNYAVNNLIDTVLYASIREQRRGVDDDGDGKIDEDPAGYAYPFRNASEMPEVFNSFGDMTMAELLAGDPESIAQVNDKVIKNYDIWFPLGFMNLSADPTDDFLLTAEYDDDMDGLYDEDGFPVSEQDYISYYYDYSPFGTPGKRFYTETGAGNHEHAPLNIRVRQMSYQWSYGYIKNMVYIEFDITNMNLRDTLYDCAMGIYMDADVGPQSWDDTERAKDDVSYYVAGDYEFAYTYDADGDNGLTTGRLGARVCTPDPDSLEFSCWYWKVGDGPDDSDPYDHSKKNEKYWLLTGRSPKEQIQDIRDLSILGAPHPEPEDTRFMFGFYGAQPGTASYDTLDNRWNLAPKATMKIVIAVFPGETEAELKHQADWAKEIYGEAQQLNTVVKPDTFPHYEPPEPPSIPKMYSELINNGDGVKVWWDNSAEFTVDNMNVSKNIIGWQDINADLDSYITDDWQSNPMFEYYPELAPFDENGNPVNRNNMAYLNPWTGFRLRHDFQGYAVYVRSGSGSNEFWALVEKWDKIETDQDYDDYNILINNPDANNLDLGGYLGIDKGLPNPRTATAEDIVYKRYDSFYRFQNVAEGDLFWGMPLYNTKTREEVLEGINEESLGFDEGALLFKHPDVPEKVYLQLYTDKYIPLKNHLGQAAASDEWLKNIYRDFRLASRVYQTEVNNSLAKGIEYYVSVTAFDRGMPSNDLSYLETGKDANMKVFFPGPGAKENGENVMVVPNPYYGLSNFDGRREKDDKGDKSKRIWFINLPERCKIRIYTLAGDLVDQIDHDGSYLEDNISISKASWPSSGVFKGKTASGIHSWDLLSKHNQIIASGLYLFSVEDLDNDEVNVGKFVIIK
ncbi:MAG: hypothetical protein CSB55_02835 [Candidatus Cloacimonadota bacterium]|nr:MAG: hypothetical protein CSB55_02835 [Candidatus Cloacimonadota bacterium]